MINKQNLWFLTLFSLILVLSVYYITMPNELLLTNNSSYEKNTEDKNNEEKTSVTVKESDVLQALRVNLEQKRTAQKAELQDLLTNNDKTADEKNEAYEKLKELNSITGQEESIETKIKQEYKLDSFVEINGQQISVVIEKSEHNSELANKIMRTIQKQFNDKVYVSVKFE